MGQLDGKVAVITGAASGMGLASAILFAREGAHVVLADLNTPGGEVAAEAASAAGPKCVFQRTDVAAEPDIQALVARALAEFGRLDIMFNNAGIGGALGSLEDISVEDWDRTQAGPAARRSSFGMPQSIDDRPDASAGRRRHRLHYLDRRPRPAMPTCTPTARRRRGW